MIRSIADAWHLFETGFDRGTPEIQRVEMRKSFYCGAAGMFKILCTNISEDHEITSADMLVMERLDQELKVFMRTLA